MELLNFIKDDENTDNIIYKLIRFFKENKDRFSNIANEINQIMEDDVSENRPNTFPGNFISK